MKLRLRGWISLILIRWVALILVIIGAINWGLIGFFDFNLVAALFGDMTMLTRTIYSLVGIAAICLTIISLIES